MVELKLVQGTNIVDREGRLDTVQRRLRVDVPEGEKLALLNGAVANMFAVNGDAELLKERHKEERKVMQARVDAADSRLRLAQEGREMRPVECASFLEDGMVSVYRMDTQQRIEHREATAEEVQQSLV